MNFDQKWHWKDKNSEFQSEMEFLIRMDSLGFFLVCLFESHDKSNKMENEEEDHKCSHMDNVGVQCSHGRNTWEGEDLLKIRDDAGIKTNQLW